jgi:hypothetical protein
MPTVAIPNLRRLVCDLIEEYGRHTGHADLIREMVDGLVVEDPAPGFGGPPIALGRWDNATAVTLGSVPVQMVAQLIGTRFGWSSVAPCWPALPRSSFRWVHGCSWVCSPQQHAHG